MRVKSAVILGLFILVAAVTHAVVSKSHPMPIRTGQIQGELHVREGTGVAMHKCNGFKVECYDSIVVVHVDNKKEPTWTCNFTMVIPWNRIEHLSLMPE
jgi:hypothetical protein